MTYLTFLTVAVSLSTLAFLPLLPAQKAEIRALSKLPSRGAGRAMWALLVALLVVGPAFAVLPVLPQTACLRIAGVGMRPVDRRRPRVRSCTGP